MNKQRLIIVFARILPILEFLCPIFAVAYFVKNFHLIDPAAAPSFGKSFQICFVSFLFFLTIPELASCLTTRASLKKGQPTSALYHLFGIIIGLYLLWNFQLSRSVLLPLALLSSLYLNYGIRMFGVFLIKRRLRKVSICKNCAMDQVEGKAVCPFCGEPY